MSSYALLHDPTKPADRSAVRTNSDIGETGLKVSTILHSKQRKLAVINGKFYKIGDSIGDLKIIAITPHAVHAKGPEGEVELPLLPTEIRSSVKK